MEKILRNNKKYKLNNKILFQEINLVKNYTDLQVAAEHAYLGRTDEQRKANNVLGDLPEGPGWTSITFSRTITFWKN